MEKVYGHRGLLNLPGHQSTAAIVAEIKGIDSRYPEVTLKISDCDRAINLDFDYRPEGHDNNLYKVDEMMRALREFRKGLVVMHRKMVKEYKDD